MDVLLAEEDIRFIFLHELQHFKHKDAALNDLACISRSSTGSIRLSGADFGLWKKTARSPVTALSSAR